MGIVEFSVRLTSSLMNISTVFGEQGELGRIAQLIEIGTFFMYSRHVSNTELLSFSSWLSEFYLKSSGEWGGGTNPALSLVP